MANTNCSTILAENLQTQAQNLCSLHEAIGASRMALANLKLQLQNLHAHVKQSSSFTELSTPSSPAVPDPTGGAPPPLARPLRFDFPRFNGDNVDRWVVNVESFFDYYRVDDSQRLTISSFHMDGVALQWYQGLLQQNQLTTWQDFTQALEIRFTLMEFSDPNGSLAEFTQKNHVATLDVAENRTSKRRLDFQPLCFSDGLQPELKYEVLSLQPTTIPQAMGQSLGPKFWTASLLGPNIPPPRQPQTATHLPPPSKLPNAQLLPLSNSTIANQPLDENFRFNKQLGDWTWYDMLIHKRLIFKQNGQQELYGDHYRGTLSTWAKFAEGSHIDKVHSTAWLGSIAFSSQLKNKLGNVATKTLVGIFSLVIISLDKFTRVGIGVCTQKLSWVLATLKVFAKMLDRAVPAISNCWGTSWLYLELFEIMTCETDSHVQVITNWKVEMGDYTGLKSIQCAKKILDNSFANTLALGDKKEVHHTLLIFVLKVAGSAETISILESTPLFENVLFLWHILHQYSNKSLYSTFMNSLEHHGHIDIVNWNTNYEGTWVLLLNGCLVSTFGIDQHDSVVGLQKITREVLIAEMLLSCFNDGMKVLKLVKGVANNGIPCHGDNMIWNNFNKLDAFYKSQDMHTHNGSLVAIELDGKYLASDGKDCILHVWQVMELSSKGDVLLDKPGDGNLNIMCMTNGSSSHSSVSPCFDNHIDAYDLRMGILKMIIVHCIFVWDPGIAEDAPPTYRTLRTRFVLKGVGMS